MRQNENFVAVKRLRLSIPNPLIRPEKLLAGSRPIDFTLHRIPGRDV